MGFVQAGRSVRPKAGGLLARGKGGRSVPPAVAAPAPPAPPAPARTLEGLPDEILYRVFVCVGVKGNALPVASKRLWQLFRLGHSAGSSGGALRHQGLIDQVVRRYFCHNLNAGVDVEAARARIGRLKAKYAASGLAATPETEAAFLRAEHTLALMARRAVVMAPAVLQWRFVTLEYLQGGALQRFEAMESERAAAVTAGRPRLVRREWRALVDTLRRQGGAEFEHMAAAAQQQFEEAGAGASPAAGAPTPDALEECRQLDQPQVVPMPARFCGPDWSARRLEMVALLAQCNFGYRQLDAALVSCTQYYEQHQPPYPLAEAIDTLARNDMLLACSVAPVVAVLRAMHHAKARGQPLAALQAALARTLALFYERRRPASSDDEMWVYLGQIRDVECYSMVKAYAGDPGPRAMTLMGW